jgi:hypothetical protein
MLTFQRITVPSGSPEFPVPGGPLTGCLPLGKEVAGGSFAAGGLDRGPESRDDKVQAPGAENL